MKLHFDVEWPGDLIPFKLPEAVNERLQNLLYLQDTGSSLTDQERREAEGLVQLAELLTWLRLRAERMTGGT